MGEDHLVMEMVEGQTLQEKIRQEGRVEPALALTLLAPIAEALDHAHESGIVHRDIKPANIMIQPDGQPKLMDFGVAHVDDSVMTATGQIIGSPSYMSPEQVAGNEVTPRSDVYSLAVVAYEMLTGQSPFHARTITAVIYRVMHDDPPPPRHWNATLPTRYDEVFAKALSKKPDERFASATALAGALDLRELELSFTELAGGEATPTGGGADGGARTTWVTVNEPPSPPPGPSPPATPGAGPSSAAGPGLGSRARRWSLAAGLAGAFLVAGLVLVYGRMGEVELPDLAPTPTAPVASPAVPGPGVTPARKAARTPAPRPERPAAKAAAAPQVEATPPAVLEGELVELGPDVTPPRRISGAPARYPEVARRRRFAGAVTVSMIITEDGEPLEPTIVESAGDVLDQAVLDAIREWRFEPARKDGVRVRVPWTVRQTFRLSR